MNATLAQSPDSSDPAAVSAYLDRLKDRALAERRATLRERAVRAARISFLEEPARTYGYARLAADILGNGSAA